MDKFVENLETYRLAIREHNFSFSVLFRKENVFLKMSVILLYLKQIPAQRAGPRNGNTRTIFKWGYYFKKNEVRKGEQLLYLQPIVLNIEILNQK